MLVEDHRMFREVLRKVCVEELGHEVIGEAEDGLEAVRTVELTRPELVLLDLHLPGLDGFRVVEEIRKLSGEIRILVLSSHCDDYTVFRVERAHVQGFVDKNSNSVAALKAAITSVEQGRVWYSEAFLREKAMRLKNPNSFDKVLTKRERELLALLGLPLADTEIAHRLELSVATVEKHRFNVMRKLEIDSAAELVRYAREHGFTLTARQERGGELLP